MNGVLSTSLTENSQMLVCVRIEDLLSHKTHCYCSPFVRNFGSGKKPWNVCRKIKLKAYWLITLHYMCMNILVPYNQEDSLVSPSLALEPPLVFLNRLRSPQKDMFTARAGSTWCCGPGAPSLEPGVDHVGVQEMRDWTKNFYNGLSTVLNGFYQQSIGIIWLQYIVWIHV